MATKNYILLKSFSKHSKIEDDFIYNLYNYGLVTIEEQENEPFIDENEISEIERFFRLHHDLGINYEGLDAIAQMLERMEQLEVEMELLRKRLRLYE